MRKRAGVISAAKRLQACVLAAFAFALLPLPAAAQWLEAGPYTSTSTAASSGIPTTNTLVYGMASQGNPVYGAANAILQSPVDPNTYWVATVSGGIWKTTDGGTSWKPTTDHAASLQIGAITLDSADPTGKTLYAATGDYSSGLYYHKDPTVTILKSTDGGNTWQSITPNGIQGQYLNSNGTQATPADLTPPSIKNIIAMGNVVLVAAGGNEGTGSVLNSGGLFRSTDGGQNFSLVPNFGTEVSSLVSASVNNQTVLFAARDGFFGRASDGILYSTDAGATWTTLLNNSTTLVSTNSTTPVVPFGGSNHDINMKVAVGPGGSLFVAVVKYTSNSEPIGLFYTPQFTPGATPTWYNLGEPQYITPTGRCRTGCTLEGNQQGFLHFALVADPNQQGVAYIAGSGQFDGSLASDEIATIVRVNYTAGSPATFTPIVIPTLTSAPHPDTRSMMLSSQGNLLVADDGGVYSLSNPSTSSGTWSAFGGVASGGSPIRAFEVFSAVMDPQTGRLGFASQDNGAGFSAPNATLSPVTTNRPWQNALGGDGFSVAVNSRPTGGGPSIMYATNDDIYLARVFAKQNISSSSPANLFEIDVGTTGQDYLTYESGYSSAPVIAVNAVDPNKLLFRSARLYTWTDPGGALPGNSIQVTDISNGTNLFGNNSSTSNYTGPWAEKIAYGTQDAPDAILAGGPLPDGTTGVYLRTQQQVNAGHTTIASGNLLSSYASLGNPGDPVGLLFDPLTERKFFIADTNNVYATANTGQTLRTLTLPTNFTNPASLAYIADSNTGNATNGVRALLVGGLYDVASSQGGIISTLNPFATNVQWMNLAPNLPNALVSDLHYYSDVDTLVAALYGRGVYVLYDVTSYYSTATALWFGKANNDSAPDVSLLTGDRLLEKFGTGTLTLSGNATYTGGTIIDAGVVAITTDANLGAPQGGITFNGGILQTNAQLASARNITLAADGTFDTEADTTLSGTISGAGALNKIGPATLALTGSNSYLGGTFVYGGALAVGFDGALGDPSGQIGIDAATLKATASFSTARTVTFGTDGGTVDVGANMLTASGLWVAQGPVTQQGAGTLALEDVGFFQNYTVSAGTLQVDGAFNGTSLQVAAGGTLTGNGQIAAATTVSGTLSPGAPGPGVLTFTAPLTLTLTSTTRIAIDGTATGGGPGTYSQVVVSGAALNLGGTLSPVFRGIGGGATNSFTPALGQQFLIASAASVSGTFAGVDLSASGLPSSLRMDTIYGSTSVDLVTTPSSFSTPPVGTVWNANQQSVAAALDALRPQAGTVSSNSALQNAINALYLLPPSQLGSLLTGLSAQGEARGVANALGTLDVFATALQDHLIGGPTAGGFNNLSLSVSGAGRTFYSAYNSMASPGSGPTGAAFQDTPSAIEPNHWWSSVYYQNSKTDSSAGIAGGSANITGFIGGIEGEVRPGQLFGIAASFAHTDASGTDSGSGDHYIVAAYGKRTAGPLQVAAYGGLAVSTIALHHDFQMGSGIVNQDSGATSLLAGGSIAYTFHLRGFDVSPIAALSFTHMLFDGTNMTSPQGFALDVPRQWTDRLRFTLGPTVTRTITTDRGVKLTASVAGGFLYQTAPVTALDALVFTAPTLGQTAPSGGAGGFADVGVYASLTNWLTGFVRWHGEAREHAHSNQVSGGLSVTF